MQRSASRNGSRDRSRDTSRACLNRRTCQVVGPLPATRPISKPKPINADSKNESSKPKEHIIHKHTVPGTSGTVEVIVKTQSKPSDSKRSRSSSKEQRDDIPWSDMLRHRSSSETVKHGAFSQFDPLRTVHFIADELGGKLDFIDDPTVKQLISDMQVALERVPREVSSISREDLSLIRREIKNAMKKPPDTKLVSSRSTTSTAKENRSTQTIVNSKQEMIEAEIMQRTFETSLANLESTCRSLESTCIALRNDKDELQRLLAVERSKLDELQKLSDSQQQKNKELESENETLKADRDSLHRQTAQLERCLETNVSQMSRESKKMIAKLRDENLNLIREVSDTKSKLMSTVFEKDKLALLVSTKEKQMVQMRSEIDAIQILIQKQFVEIDREDRKSQLLCSSRSGSGDSNSPPAWDAQMLSSIRNSLSPPIKEATPEVQDLFRNIIHEKALRGDAPSPHVYGSLKVDPLKTKNVDNQSYKELPTYYSDQSDWCDGAVDSKIAKKTRAESIERTDQDETDKRDGSETDDVDGMLDKMIDLKSEGDIDRLLEEVKKMAAENIERVTERLSDAENRSRASK